MLNIPNVTGWSRNIDTFGQERVFLTYMYVIWHLKG